MIALPHRRPAEPPTAPATHKKGDLVRVKRNGVVDLAEVVSTWTTGNTGIDMLTVVLRPFGFYSFDVRADSVLSDDAPDVRHDATECASACETHRAERAAAKSAERWAAA